MSEESSLHQSAKAAPHSAKPDYEFVVDDTAMDDSETAANAEQAKLGFRRRKPSARQEARILSYVVGILVVLSLFVLGVFVLFVNQGAESPEASSAAHTGVSANADFNMKNNWGSYSPYFEDGVPFEGISHNALSGEYTLPETCEYRQVHILHRHGDRFPSGGTYKIIQKAAEKIANMDKPPAKELAWLENWNMTLGSEILVAKGVANLFDSGSQFWGSHGRLLYNATDKSAWSEEVNVYDNGTSRAKPVLRATTQYRIQDSARAWAAGFFGAYGRPSSGIDPSEQYELVLQTEAEGQNNSLAAYFGCPNTGKKGAETGAHRKKKWVKTYLKDAAKRLQKLLPGYKDFDTTDALAFQDLCAFETAAYGSSSFCELFTKKEWRGFEYHIDLNFYGDSGWGSATGPATGLPWLHELYARLSGELITDTNFGVNVTLDSNPETFPLDQPFYLDVTHDSVIFSVLSALQFDFLKTDLPSHKIKAPRQLVISRLTPFGARLYVEILSCGDGDHVRLKLNNRVLPLGDLKYCPEDHNGLCSLKEFTKSIKHALEAIDFVDTCYGDHKYNAAEDDEPNSG